MNKIAICIDIDNVICDTDSIIRNIIHEYTQGRVTLEYSDITNFDYYMCTDSNNNYITVDEWIEVHELFIENKNITSIITYENIKEHFAQLYSIANLSLVTSRPPSTMDATKSWLAENEIVHHEIHFLELGMKHKADLRYHFSIEDHYPQAKQFALNGTMSILMKHPWNENKQEIENLLWAENWDEISNIILSNY